MSRSSSSSSWEEAARGKGGVFSHEWRWETQGKGGVFSHLWQWKRKATAVSLATKAVEHKRQWNGSALATNGRGSTQDNGSALPSPPNCCRCRCRRRPRSPRHRRPRPHPTLPGPAGPGSLTPLLSASLTSPCAENDPRAEAEQGCCTGAARGVAKQRPCSGGGGDVRTTAGAPDKGGVLAVRAVAPHTAKSALTGRASRTLGRPGARGTGRGRRT